MKIYVAMGDDLSLTLGPAKNLYDFVAAVYEPQFLNSNLDSVDGKLCLGGYAEASADLGLKKFGNQITAGVGVDLSAGVEGRMGYGEVYGANVESYHSSGIAASGSGCVNVGVWFGKDEKENKLKLSLFDVGSEVESEAKV